MKALSLLAVITLFVAPSLQQEGDYTSQRSDSFPACRGEFKKEDKICSKFGFVSSEEAVKKGCVNPTNGTTYYDLSALPQVNNLDPQKVLISGMITNVFEDGDPFFAYAACSDIGDLRGYTCGYPGFTTGTGDAEAVIAAYTDHYPNNALSKHLTRIHQISELPHCDRKNRGNTTGLEGFCDDWKRESCSSNGEFNKLQRDWVYNQYMLAGARYAADNGVVSPLGQAIFYDTIIQHGYQYVEPDINIVRILVLTGPRQKEETEPTYLTRFLTTRRQLQCCYPDDVWPASATRSEDFQRLVNDFEKNKNLDPPIYLKNFERTITGKEDVSRDVKRCPVSDGNSGNNGNNNTISPQNESLGTKNQPFAKNSLFNIESLWKLYLSGVLMFVSLYVFRM